MKYLFRKKAFWLLIVLICALPVCFTVLKFFGIGKNPRTIAYVGNPDTIQYVGTPGNGAAIEKIGAGQPVHKAEDSFPSQGIQNPSSSAVQSAMPVRSAHDSGVKTFLTDSIQLWLKAFNGKNITRFLSFYDTLNFRYPGGTFGQWASENRLLIIPRENALSLVIDSIWSDSLAKPFFQTDFSATYSAGDTTARRIYSLVWQFSNFQWRIVRQKYKEQP